MTESELPISPEILLILTVVFTIGASFFCSVLEAALLSVNVPSVIDRKEKGSRGAALLLKLKTDRIEDAISAILSLNTVSNTIGSVTAGNLAGMVLGGHWLITFPILLVLGILIFSEIIPKTIGAVYASRMMGFVGYTVNVLTFVMWPLVVLSRLVTSRITNDDASKVTRGDISAMLSMAAAEGAITAHQSYLFASLLNSDQINLSDVMTPRSVMVTLPVETTRQELTEQERWGAFSRLPVYQDNPENIIGYIVVRQAMAAALRHDQDFSNLNDFVRPLTFLPRTYSVGDALRALTRKNEQLALVLDEYGTVRGLVTMEDLIETLLGIEIMDETDHTSDMRELAERLRNSRLARLDLVDPENDSPEQKKGPVS